jgi:hypothetical protein
MYGTDGAYEENSAGRMWTSLPRKEAVDITQLLRCDDHFNPAQDAHIQEDYHGGTSAIHPVSRLPENFNGLGNGHSGSHQFLVDDFVKAVVNGWIPPNNAWASARYLLPGLTAHDSAMRGGELLSVPDFGDSPADRTHAPLDTIII